jgi:hypothetical protein
VPTDPLTNYCGQNAEQNFPSVSPQMLQSLQIPQHPEPGGQSAEVLQHRNAACADDGGLASCNADIVSNIAAAM